MIINSKIIGCAITIFVGVYLDSSKQLSLIIKRILEIPEGIVKLSNNR